jgi:hypothetical protein
MYKSVSRQLRDFTMLTTNSIVSYQTFAGMSFYCDARKRVELRKCKCLQTYCDIILS